MSAASTVFEEEAVAGTERPITEAAKAFRSLGYDNEEIAGLFLNAAALFAREGFAAKRVHGLRALFRFEGLARQYWRVAMRQTRELAREALGLAAPRQIPAVSLETRRLS